MHCRDRLFKATYPTSPKKEKPFQPNLISIEESQITRINSKEDVANAVQSLMNSNYSPKRNVK